MIRNSKRPGEQLQDFAKFSAEAEWGLVGTAWLSQGRH